MSIEKTSSALAGLLEQLPVSSKAGSSPAKENVSSFQGLLNDDPVTEPTAGVTETQGPAPGPRVRSATPSQPSAPATINMERTGSIAERASSTPERLGRGTQTPSPTAPVANPPAATGRTAGADSPRTGAGSGGPARPQDPLDPSPAAPWPTIAIQPYPTPELAAQAKSAVFGALEKEGIQSTGVKISYWEELVLFPGGNYTNKNITVQVPNGRKIDLDAAYMARCPWLAASAVKDLNQA